MNGPIPKEIVERAMHGLNGVGYSDAEACLEASGLWDRVRGLERALNSLGAALEMLSEVCVTVEPGPSER
jgi:hypothetical protein